MPLARARSRRWIEAVLRHRSIGAALVVLALGGAVAPAVFAQGGAASTAKSPLSAAPAPRAQYPDYRLQARALAPGVYVVEGENDDFSLANGCNIINTGFIVTGAGVVVINTGPNKRYGEQLRALIRRTTSEAVVQVLHLNLHPDYFLGNQAFADVPRFATPRTRAGMGREAAAYETNLYRLCGDWMLGTEALLPDRDLAVSAMPEKPPSPNPASALAGHTWRVGSRELQLFEWAGHTDSDLVLLDKASGVAFVGGLVFNQRVPTTPHADIGAWLSSLSKLQGLPIKTTVPSHGPVHQDRQGETQTRRYLQWLDSQFSRFAAEGWEMNEVLRAPVPAEFKQWAAFKTEFVRNVAHLYPRFERAALAASAQGTQRP